MEKKTLVLGLMGYGAWTITAKFQEAGRGLNNTDAKSK
jgi:hypothetical protein